MSATTSSPDLASLLAQVEAALATKAVASLQAQPGQVIEEDAADLPLDTAPTMRHRFVVKEIGAGAPELSGMEFSTMDAWIVARARQEAAAAVASALPGIVAAVKAALLAPPATPTGA